MVQEFASEDASKFHDSEISSIEIMKSESEMRVGLLMPSGIHAYLAIKKIRFVRITDFVMQNVISEIRISKYENFSEEELKRLVNWSNSFSDVEIELTPDSMRKFMEDISNGRLQVLAIEPSRGAEAVIIAEKIFVSWGE
ncbi:hypothetical protein [Pandoraea commovens]|uniref:Uncharacterized protein n=1 Tax=Pandoraea commovens TaxID=2508289 RepID=A0A5E4YHI3_9BURK|nr:hypothetical protein [Pandoraea commovens]UVA79140.1 hypothetical protein NTU39_24580 [Pandoraea commovens]VVE48211.1 hypothetical protein PCO31010_04541 [Pandoraea commovens]